MPDFVCEVSEAIETGHKGAMAAMTERWEQDAWNFWVGADTGAEASGGTKTRAKLFRAKAWRLFCALNHMLVVCRGVGLSAFAVPASSDRRQEPHLWPTLTLSLDQRSDGWSMGCYLLWGTDLCVRVAPDPSHRGWNDAQLALRDVGMYGIVLLTTIALNWEHGPWKDGRWLAQARESAAAYVQVARADSCPVYQGLFSRILQETGQEDQIGRPGLEADVFADLPSVGRKMPDKVALSRWFGFVDSAEAYLGVWHRKLVGCLYLSITLGLFSDQGQPGNVLASSALAPSRSEDVAKQRTSVEVEAIQRLRKACKHTLYLVTLLLADDVVHRAVRTIVYCLGPLRAWHGVRSKLLRSSAEAHRW